MLLGGRSCRPTLYPMKKGRGQSFVELTDRRRRKKRNHERNEKHENGGGKTARSFLVCFVPFVVINLPAQRSHNLQYKHEAQASVSPARMTGEDGRRGTTKGTKNTKMEEVKRRNLFWSVSFLSWLSIYRRSVLTTCYTSTKGSTFPHGPLESPVLR